MPTISVIVPTFNRAKVLQTALTSVLSQSFQDLELIVVDDGSTEDLRSMCPALHDQRVHYIRQANQGAGAARNTGLDAAKGGYISFLDSDDVFLPDNLALLYGHLVERPEVGVAHGWASIVDHAGREAQRTRPILEGWVHEHYLISNPTPVGTMLVRRECFQAGHRFDADLPIFEDWDLWLRLAFSYQFGCVRSLVARVCFQDVQRSSSRSAESAAQVLQSIYQKLLADPAAAPVIQRRWRALMANTHVMAGHHHRMFEQDMSAARREFIRAMSLAPGFAPAYVGLVEAVLGPAAIAHLRAVRSRLFAVGQSTIR